MLISEADVCFRRFCSGVISQIKLYPKMGISCIKFCSSDNCTKVILVGCKILAVLSEFA